MGGEKSEVSRVGEMSDTGVMIDVIGVIGGWWLDHECLIIPDVASEWLVAAWTVRS